MLHFSSYNWNTLFLGANAVADVMAEKFATSKSKLLDAVSRNSELYCSEHELVFLVNVNFLKKSWHFSSSFSGCF